MHGAARPHVHQGLDPPVIYTRRRWQLLHRLVYITGVAAVVHYYWLVKSDVRLPLLYGSLVAILLAYRAASRLWTRRAPAV